MEREKILREYYNPQSVGGFGGINRLRHSLKNRVRISEIKSTLQTSPTYTKHKSSLHAYPRRKYNVHTSNYLWQADLLVLPKYSKQNKNYKYILTCIDVFSKKGYAIPIKHKTGEEVTASFKTILNNAKTKPKFLQTDMGLEFENAKFRMLLSANDNKHFTVHSDKKASVVERFNRTLMMRLHKYFDYTGKFNYIDVLADILSSYNNSPHRTIGCSPNSVNKYNEMDVWLKTNKDLYTKAYKKPKSVNVGDMVRIKVPKSTFQKGYEPNYSQDLYKVTEILSTKPVTYKLVDADGENLLGIFYSNEISKVIL